MAELWEKQKYETNRAFEAFQIYLFMGYKRTLNKAAKELGYKSGQYLRELSRKNHWQKRIEAYDKWQAQEALKKSKHQAAELAKNCLALFEAPAIAISKKLASHADELENMSLKDLFGMLFQTARHMGKLSELQAMMLTNIVSGEGSKSESQSGLTELLNNDELGDKINELLRIMESTKNSVAGDNGEIHNK